MTSRPPQHNPPRRVFTRADDELIMANAAGRMSLHRLVHELHCGEETAMRRAAELGVEIKRRKSVGGRHPRGYERNRKHDPRSDIVYPADGRVDIPHVGKDMLLRRLYQHHEDRRYEALQIRSKETLT